eukprot:755348-Hanusia_phi.AAC.7
MQSCTLDHALLPMSETSDPLLSPTRESFLDFDDDSQEINWECRGSEGSSTDEGNDAGQDVEERSEFICMHLSQSLHTNDDHDHSRSTNFVEGLENDTEYCPEILRNDAESTDCSNQSTPHDCFESIEASRSDQRHANILMDAHLQPEVDPNPMWNQDKINGYVRTVMKIRMRVSKLRLLERLHEMFDRLESDETLRRSFGKTVSVLGFESFEVQDVHKFVDEIGIVVTAHRCSSSRRRGDIRDQTQPAYDLLRCCGISPVRSCPVPPRDSHVNRTRMHFSHFTFCQNKMRANMKWLGKAI